MEKKEERKLSPRCPSTLQFILYTCNKNLTKLSFFSRSNPRQGSDRNRGTVGWFRFPRPGCSSQLRGANFNGRGRRREREELRTPLRLRCADAGDKIGGGARRQQCSSTPPPPLPAASLSALFFAVAPALPARVAVCVVRFFLLGPSGGIP
jgi:hypothetical protein